MDDIDKLTPAEQEAQLLESLSKMSQDEQNAAHDLIRWIAYDRPKDAEPLTKERVSELFREVLHENIRRRLGGRTGIILQFPKIEKDE